MKTDLLFVQQFPIPYFGILAINAYLRKLGFRVDVLIEEFEKDLALAIRKAEPSLIGFSVFSSEHLWLKKISGDIHKKFPDVPLAAGGIHAKVYAQEILRETDCDFVCLGEGEQIMADILGEMRRAGRKAYRRCSGIAYKKSDGRIQKNSLAQSIDLLEDIVEDRDIYFRRYPRMKEDDLVFFMHSRGCPYACTFCYNAYLRDLRKNTFLSVRQKKPEILIQEIELLRMQCDIKVISFLDDTFTFNTAWLKKFLDLYRKRLKIPFGCSTRANEVTEQTAFLLRQAGCRFVTFGIETGNEKIRREILNKQISNQDIVKAGKLLSSRGIIVRSSNMFCLPNETLKDALSTIALNIKSCVQSASSMLLLPYPKTKISEYCLKNNFLKKKIELKDLPFITQRVSLLSLPHKKKIMNVHYLTYWFVRYPIIFRYARGVVVCEWLNKFFYLVFLLGFFIRNKNEAGLTWGRAIVFAWHKRRLMVKR